MFANSPKNGKREEMKGKKELLTRKQRNKEKYSYRVGYNMFL
jgi:hypothetical protein